MSERTQGASVFNVSKSKSRAYEPFRGPSCRAHADAEVRLWTYLADYLRHGRGNLWPDSSVFRIGLGNRYSLDWELGRGASDCGRCRLPGYS
jgi:hypothetical protein